MTAALNSFKIQALLKSHQALFRHLNFVFSFLLFYVLASIEIHFHFLPFLVLYPSLNLASLIVQAFFFNIDHQL
jgi:hypothetical protein